MFTLPYPTSPENGQSGDATPILANFIAIAQALQALDGTALNAKSVLEAALADAVNPRLRGSETLANFVYSGCSWSAISGLTATMTGGTIYVNGYRTIVTGVGSNTFLANSDTYIDIDYLGNVTYQAVANNATNPALTANSVRVARVVTNATTVTAINQSGSDNIGNPLYPTTSYPVRAAEVVQLGDSVTSPGWHVASLDTFNQNTGGFLLSGGGLQVVQKGLYRVDVRASIQDGNPATIIACLSVNTSPGNIVSGDVTSGRNGRAPNPGAVSGHGLMALNAGQTVYFHYYADGNQNFRFIGGNTNALDNSKCYIELIKPLP